MEAVTRRLVEDSDLPPALQRPVVSGVPVEPGGALRAELALIPLHLTRQQFSYQPFVFVQISLSIEQLTQKT
jgi:hypothetical protein